MQNVVLEVKNLTKKFSSFTAVDNLSFSIKEGEILGLLGPNGAGKTTTTQMLLGVTEPFAGDIKYFGKPFKKHRETILRQVNFSSSYISLPWLLTIEEILNVFALLYEIPNRKQRIEKLLSIFEIEELFKKQFFQLSSGQRTRVMLVKAFLNYPKILLLDEPTASLDPDIATKVREFLKKERKEFNVSMLFTSHNMAEVEELCDRIVVINKGKKINEGTPAEIAQDIKDCKVNLLMNEDNLERSLLFLKRKSMPVVQDGFYVTITLSEKQIPHLLSSLAKESITYEEISIEKPDLEDYFLTIANKEKYD